MDAPRPRWRNWFEVGSTVAMLTLAATLVWQRSSPQAESTRPPQRQATVPAEPVRIDGSPTLGVASARLAIVEFADFQCPACRVFATTVKPSIVKEYVETGRVKLVFKHFPLSAIHPHAKRAAHAAACAFRQDRFWEMHDTLFTARSFEDTVLQNAAQALGLELTQYGTCLRDVGVDSSIDADKSQGDALEVGGTPTFYFGTIRPDGRVQVTKVVSGVSSLGGFKAILDGLLE